jgi:hypothetical protein
MFDLCLIYANAAPRDAHDNFATTPIRTVASISPEIVVLGIAPPDNFQRFSGATSGRSSYLTGGIGFHNGFPESAGRLPDEDV